MSDEDRVARWGAEIRAEWAARAPQWEELAAGRCTPAEAAAGVRADHGAVTDEEIAAAQVLFAPLDEDFDAKLVDRLHAMSQAGAQGPEVASLAAARERTAWRRTAGAVAAVLLAAAAVLLINLWSTPSPPDLKSEAVVARALPAYEGWIEGKSVVRAAGESSLHAGESLRLYLRPAEAVEGMVTVHACLRRSDTTTALPTSGKPQPAGETLEIEVALPSDLPPGPAELLAVVDGTAATSIDCAAMQASSSRGRPKAEADETPRGARVVVTLPVHVSP
jgi:hypothetical protein